MKTWILCLLLKVCFCADYDSLEWLKDSSLEKIVGGYDASLGDAPWQVLVTRKEGFRTWYCGGTLLSPQVVVTAAHCKPSSGGTTVSLGGLYRRDLPLQYSVKEVFVHENYEPSYKKSRNNNNDIALLILEGTVNVPSLECVEPASLPNADDDDNDFENKEVLISGWGNTESQQTTHLQRASVMIFSQDRCKKSYKSYGNRYTDNMICAGVEDYSKDTCQGDSGGPLVLKRGKVSILVGITSWGKGCADKDYPGVYTKVTKYVSWIKKKACDGGGCLNKKKYAYTDKKKDGHACLNGTMNNPSVITISGFILIHVFLSIMGR